MLVSDLTHNHYGYGRLPSSVLIPARDGIRSGRAGCEDNHVAGSLSGISFNSEVDRFRRRRHCLPGQR
jgi:hypothetical protein